MRRTDQVQNPHAPSKTKVSLSGNVAKAPAPFLLVLRDPTTDLAQPRHAMLREIAIISLEDRRPLRHVSLSEGEGGDDEERREVEAEYQCGLRGSYVRARWHEGLLVGVSGEGVSEKAVVLSEEEPAGVLEGFGRDRQGEDQALEGEGVEEPEVLDWPAWLSAAPGWGSRVSRP